MSDQRTRFIVVRHGETHWNVERRHQGHLDSPLTPLGLAQAKALGERLQQVRLDALISSDLPRATETAEQVLAFQPAGLAVRYLPQLRERNLGIFGGLTSEQAAEQYPQAYAHFRSGDPEARLPQGESLRDLYERISAAMDALAEDFAPGQTVAVVTHGGALEQFLRYVLGIPLDAARACKFVNAACNVFSYAGAGVPSAPGRIQNKWLLHVWGEVSHLGSLEAADDI